jgi:probable HAF family extracellular repeat protein
MALGINNAGVIVGVYVDVSGYEHGFRYENSAFHTIDFPHAVHTHAFGISDRGEVVGF